MGVGKLIPFTMNRSMSLLLKSGKILSVGRETEAGTSVPACSSLFPLERGTPRWRECHSGVQVAELGLTSGLCSVLTYLSGTYFY